MNLDELEVGRDAVVSSVDCDEAALRQHILDMGLTPGVEVTLMKRAPLGDPLEIRLRGYELTLRRDDAARIAVTDVHDAHDAPHGAERVLTGRYTAIPVFVAIMALVFWLTFDVVGQRLSDLLALGIDWLTAQADAALAAFGINLVVHSLVIDGVFAGVGSVLSFMPIIVVLFILLSILEDSGYMARVVIWFLQNFDLRLNVVDDQSRSMLAGLGALLSPIFAPLGFGS